MTIKQSGYQNMHVEGKDPTKDNPYDFYATPYELAKAALEVLKRWHFENHGQQMLMPDLVIDPGAGDGVWGRAAKEVFMMRDGHAPGVIGIDLRNLPAPARGYNWWFPNTDYLTSYPAKRGNGTAIVIGNPPYGVSGGKRVKGLAEQFIRHSMNLLKPDEYCYFLLKSVFTEGIDRGYGLFTEFKPAAIFQSVRRVPFRPEENGNKTNTVAYSMFLFKKPGLFKARRTEIMGFDWAEGKGKIVWTKKNTDFPKSCRV